jgi:hypothetical protein
MAEGTDYSVTDVPTRHRFEIKADHDLAGFTEYRRSRRLIAFLHTEVAPEFEGHGVGSQLISTALDTARNHQMRVLPFCPFVRGYIEKHTDAYLDLVPANLREDFSLPAPAEAPQS